MKFLENKMEKKGLEFTQKNIDHQNWGILINERVVNLPLIIIPELFKQLMEDKYFIDSSEEYTEDEKQNYSFDFLFYFTTAQKKAEDLEKIEEKDLLFQKVEDKIFFKKAISKTILPHDLGPNMNLLLLLLKFEDFVTYSLDNKTYKSN